MGVLHFAMLSLAALLWLEVEFYMVQWITWFTYSLNVVSYLISQIQLENNNYAAFDIYYNESCSCKYSSHYCCQKLEHDDVIKWKLTICLGNSPITGEFPAQRPVTRSFDIFSSLRLNKRLNKQSWGWWFETQLQPLWRHCNDVSSLSRIDMHVLWHIVQNTIWHDHFMISKR